MNQDHSFAQFLKRQEPLVIALFIMAIISLAVGGYEYYVLNQDLVSKTASYEKQIADLQTNLSNANNQNTILAGQLSDAQAVNNSFQGQIAGISSTVGTLQKIAATDPELLKKYSKISFLNENYIPASLTFINDQYLYDKNKPQQILNQVWPHLNTLLLAASSTGLHLQVISAYRSFGAQSGLKASYKVTFGAGTANSFSADQGYSEHQLGTALDFTTPKVADTFSPSLFERSPENTWLLANAWQYGFVLSYPKNNPYYIYEPWHWRYVGVKLATDLHNQNIYFYDMDQRTIDSYLVNFFD
jgi:LAS superfamily LD-carboxypeptidase LdcB